MDIRCPSCARLLVLRSGPQVRPHYAHRPRQSCRKRPGHPAASPPHLEQLTLFDLEAGPAHEHFELEPDPGYEDLEREPVLVPLAARPAPIRRRRRAWLPRLLRRLRRRSR